MKRGLGCRISAYGDIILEATARQRPPAKAHDTHQVEEVMRTQHPTMDHLTREYLIKLAREAWRAVQQLRQEGVYKTPTEENPYP